MGFEFWVGVQSGAKAVGLGRESGGGEDDADGAGLRDGADDPSRCAEQGVVRAGGEGGRGGAGVGAGVEPVDDQRSGEDEAGMGVVVSGRWKGAGGKK